MSVENQVESRREEADMQPPNAETILSRTFPRSPMVGSSCSNLLVVPPFSPSRRGGRKYTDRSDKGEKKKKEKNWPRIGPTWPTEIRRKRCHRSTALAIIGRVFHRKFPTKFSYFLFSLRLRPLNRYVTLLHLIDL